MTKFSSNQIFAPWAIIVTLLLASEVHSQETKKAVRTDFVSDASFVVGTHRPTQIEHTPEAMASAATNFLGSLTSEQKTNAMHKLDSLEREKWTNLPAPQNAGGVRLGDLNKEQVALACDLMANLFSQHGYNKMRDIMLADDQLLQGGQPRSGFGTENFSIVIFGEPSASEAWAFQLDGHHVGVNLAMKGESITMSPSFIGTQPQMFKIANTSYRPFAKETDLAHQLAMSLTDGQVKQAVLRPKRARILTGPGNDGKVPKAKGVACSTFSSEQKEVLVKLISQWVNDLPEKQASQRMEQIESEVDEMKFSWNGNREPKSDVSYTIQSPSLIIEYACQNLGGDPLDHLHSVFRNPKNEYGGQYGNNQ